MPVANWYGVSRRKPRVIRVRDEDGWYGLRVTCWHGKEAVLVSPDKDTALSWEYPASVLPCAWIGCREEERKARERANRRLQQSGHPGSAGRHDGGAGSAVADFWANLDRDGDG